MGIAAQGKIENTAIKLGVYAEVMYLVLRYKVALVAFICSKNDSTKHDGTDDPFDFGKRGLLFACNMLISLGMALWVASWPDHQARFVRIITTTFFSHFAVDLVVTIPQFLFSKPKAWSEGDKNKTGLVNAAWWWSAFWCLGFCVADYGLMQMAHSSCTSFGGCTAVLYPRASMMNQVTAWPGFKATGRSAGSCGSSAWGSSSVVWGVAAGATAGATINEIGACEAFQKQASFSYQWDAIKQGTEEAMVLKDPSARVRYTNKGPTCTLVKARVALADQKLFELGNTDVVEGKACQGCMATVGSGMDTPWWKTTLKTDICPIASTKDRNDEHCECVMELSSVMDIFVDFIIAVWIIGMWITGPLIGLLMEVLKAKVNKGPLKKEGSLFEEAEKRVANGPTMETTAVGVITPPSDPHTAFEP